MFTGLIKAKGTLTAIDKSDGEGGDWLFQISPFQSITHQTGPSQTGPSVMAWDYTQMAIGASIACSGVCLTVIAHQPDYFEVAVSAETRARTILGQGQLGTILNLEPSLTMGAELGGHFVSGHVDAIAHIDSITPLGNSHQLEIRPPAYLMRFIAEKGAVTLDGISLTVNEVRAAHFSVNIIQHTWQQTNLEHAIIGQALNIEIDMIARYLDRLLGGFHAPDQQKEQI